MFHTLFLKIGSIDSYHLVLLPIKNTKIASHYTVIHIFIGYMTLK